ncbi:MAG: hypothetical protein ACRD1N_05125 [Terriglobia bacterium]
MNDTTTDNAAEHSERHSATNWLIESLDWAKLILGRLLDAPKLHFDITLRSRLPETHGIYAISLMDAPPGAYLRAGRTNSAAGGLRQRVYQNHLMGDQKDNLRAQLAKDGQCPDLDHAKIWIREHCCVQVLVIENDDERQWAEHFILAVLRPKYGD